MRHEKFPALISFVLILCAVGSCDKSIKDNEPLKPLQPANLDVDAGNWTMIVMTGPMQIAVAAPADITSDAYKAELAAFIECCRANQPFPSTHRDGLRAQQVISAGMQHTLTPDQATPVV